MLKAEMDTSFENIIIRKWADQVVMCLVKHVHMKSNTYNDLIM